jgi:hypothetical protein
MSMTADEILQESLKQDVRTRARIAHLLLESLEALSADENARLWAEEAQLRDDEIEGGATPERPFEDVLREARGRLK